MIQASSSGRGSLPAARMEIAPPSRSTAHTPASANTSSARSSGSSASTGTYAAPAARTPRIAMYSSAVPEEILMPTRSPLPMPTAASLCDTAATSAASRR
jgi:hypothetical protein